MTRARLRARSHKKEVPFMFRRILVAIIGFWLPACAMFAPEPQMTQYCAREAVMQAMEFMNAEKTGARIAYGFHKEADEFHAQAQGFVEGRWVFLGRDINGTVIPTGKSEFRTVWRFYTLPEFLAQYEGWNLPAKTLGNLHLKR